MIEFKDLQELSSYVDEDTILTQLKKVICKYIPSNDFFQFFIHEYNLTGTQEIEKFFKHMNEYHIIDYIKGVLDHKIVSDFLTTNQYRLVGTLSHFIREINELLEDNDIMLCSILTDIKKYLITFLCNYTHDTQLLDPNELYRIDDKIKNEHLIYKVDIENRDKPFIDIDHNVIIATTEQIHRELINTYYDNKLKGNWKRPTDDELQQANIEKIAFGHICNNVYIIDSIKNMTIDDVVQDMKDAGINGKIYYYFPETPDYGTAIRKASK